MQSRGIALAIVLLATRAWEQQPLTLNGHGGWVGAVAFSPDSGQLAIGASDGSVYIRDVLRREKVVVLQSHEDAVAALAWSADSRLLASGGHEGVVLLHEIGPNPRLAGRHHVLRGH